MKNKKQRELEVEKAKKKKASIQRGERASGKVKRVGVRAALDKSMVQNKFKATKHRHT